MTAKLPKQSAALGALLRSDFTTQWRNRRALVLVLLVPLIILLFWKPMVTFRGRTFVLSTCITIGITAIGLLGYANTLVRDREKGIFQRLRLAPIPAPYIMISRLAVQVAVILLVTTLVFTVGHDRLQLRLNPIAYPLGLAAAIIGGAVYLGLGQMIAGLQKNAETVNATTRLVYFLFIMVGLFGDQGILGAPLKKVVQWSPYGTVRTVIAAALQPEVWSADTTAALAVCLGYAALFSFLGIKWFRWDTQ